MNELTQKQKVVAINLSNHPSDKWSQEQRDAFYSLVMEGYQNWKVDFQIIDIPFPNVPPEADILEVKEIAENVLKELGEYNFKYIMCQGEFSLTYNLVKMLKGWEKIPVVATTKREVVEKENGEKISVFKFVRFRVY